MKVRKAYRATDVNRVDWSQVAACPDGARVGLDVGKFEVRGVLRWSNGTFERPWRARNPEQIGELVSGLVQLSEGRELIVAMEPTGTYGDALRQCLGDAGLTVHRVSPKAACDYAEVFDGVPSQHDGKDAAVVAELSALGKSWPWPCEPPEVVDQELAYWVDWMDAQQRLSNLWCGRLEGLVARHWPEATRTLKVSRATLLRALAHYGGPAGLAADPAAASRLAQWGGRFLQPQTIQELLSGAAGSRGVRQGAIDLQRMRQYATEALKARSEVRRSQRRLADLARTNAVIQAQAAAVGVGTACVLWVHLGDPRHYHCGAAYRKAMGLNLAERSSGTWKGQLKISKRGSSQVRRWLYLAALRLVRKAAVERWYRVKKARDGQTAGRALVGVMRRLSLALYAVGCHQSPFEPRRLFPGELKPANQGVASAQEGRRSMAHV
jgi:transposase